MTPSARDEDILLESSDGVQHKLQGNNGPLETYPPISPAELVLNRADEREMCEESVWRDASQGLVIAALQLLLMKLSRVKRLEGTVAQCRQLHSP